MPTNIPIYSEHSGKTHQSKTMHKYKNYKE